MVFTLLLKSSSIWGRRAWWQPPHFHRAGQSSQSPDRLLLPQAWFCSVGGGSPWPGDNSVHQVAGEVQDLNLRERQPRVGLRDCGSLRPRSITWAGRPPARAGHLPVASLYPGGQGGWGGPGHRPPHSRAGHQTVCKGTASLSQGTEEGQGGRRQGEGEAEEAGGEGWPRAPET